MYDNKIKKYLNKILQCAEKVLIHLMKEKKTYKTFLGSEESCADSEYNKGFRIYTKIWSKHKKSVFLVVGPLRFTLH